MFLDLNENQLSLLPDYCVATPDSRLLTPITWQYIVTSGKDAKYKYEYSYIRLRDGLNTVAILIDPSLSSQNQPNRRK